MRTQLNSRKDPHRIDVAIVGGGITGLYCGFNIHKLMDSKRFRTQFTESAENQVVIFEASSRPGGRVCTRRFPEPESEDSGQKGSYQSGKGEPDLSKIEFYADFGPMRIEEDQKLLHSLLKDDLKIEQRTIDGKVDMGKAHLVPFPAFSSPVSTHEPKYHLVGAENEQTTPWDLMLLAFARILRRLQVSKGKETGSQGANASERLKRFKGDRRCLQRKLEELQKLLDYAGSPILADPTLWKLKFENWISTLQEEHYQHLREHGKFDGEPLWNIGFWNLLSDVLSHDAVMKLRDLGTFYHLIPENPNAVEWLIFWLRNIKGSKALKGIYGGMECITERLRKELEKKVEIKTDYKLIKIKPKGDRVLLTFETSSKTKPEERERKSFSAGQVILALPKAPLQKLALTNSQYFPEEVVGHLDAVLGFPMVKVFVVVKHRWWEEEYRANFNATRVPTRELHYWKVSKRIAEKA